MIDSIKNRKQEGVYFLLRIVGTIILFAAAYVIVMKNLPLSDFAFLTAGSISMYLLFGLDSLKSLFTKPRMPFRNIVVTFICLIMMASLGATIIHFLNIPVTDNPIDNDAALAHPIMTVIGLFPALLGEEFIGVVSFLIVANLADRANANQTLSIIIGLIVSALIFGASHIETYRGNLVQAIILIGSLRLPLTCSILKSNSIYTGWITHFVYDAGFFIAGVIAIGMQ